MLIGTLFALAAGLMWGLVFVGPLLLADYPAVMLSFGRYLAFGLIALPLAWWDRAALRTLTRADWLEALKLALVGNIIYYLCLSSAIQRAGAPLPTMIIGTLPVVIALVSNRRNAARDGTLPWRRLAPSLGLIALGIGLVNQAEWQALRADPQADLGRYALGAALALAAVVCWTWYPIRNADWLRAHAERSPRTWATAQGIATLPLALLGFALTWLVFALTDAPWVMPLGPRPGAYVGLMLAIGLLASWLGTLCWNEASQRLPTNIAGQLIVFETLSALAYAFVLRGEWPGLPTAAGIALLIAGVWWALRVDPEPAAADAHPN
ncbi:DMT family transporter [Ideonella sp. 4Y11]|uniref:DMT family transporter n=1 Tax=Ideonella aquatica TaxID=2824119 RepID=A0A940YQY7_9BURK|nr:DMT family transporter [Ideonella aquatica]MBQ0961282.1 DMT family transporter [Ideonella aquatica]